MSQSSHQGVESLGRVFGAHGLSLAPSVTAKWTAGEEGGAGSLACCVLATRPLCRSQRQAGWGRFS